VPLGVDPRDVTAVDAAAQIATGAQRQAIAGRDQVDGRTHQRDTDGTPVLDHAGQRLWVEIVQARPHSSRARLSARNWRRLERSFIRGRSVDRRHCRLVEPQIHSQLAAVMRQVIEHGIAKHKVSRPLTNHTAGDDKPPWRHQVLVRGVRQRFARLRDMTVEGVHGWSAAPAPCTGRRRAD
jgi:hypothetical protein